MAISHYTRRERMGLIALLAIIVISVAAMQITKSSAEPEKDSSTENKYIRQLIAPSKVVASPPKLISNPKSRKPSRIKTESKRKRERTKKLSEPLQSDTIMPADVSRKM